MARLIRISLVLPVCASGISVPQDVADKFGAKCLNGNAPTFELTRNESSTKWVLFLEGGGWCYGSTENATKKSCAGRGGFVWPPNSAETLAQTAEKDFGNADIGGVMSQDAAVNPDFHTWNKAFLHYCDGASFGGGREEPIAVSKPDGSPGQLWLRGRHCFDALISYLQTEQGMGGATEVILSGGSAGGLAVLYNLDHLATLLPSTVRLTGFPDAGFFLDAPTVNGDYQYRANFQGADPVWNVTGSGGTNLKCLSAHKGEEWKCLMAPYIVPHIETPLFVMNSAYDAWQLSNVLSAPCLPAPSHSPCSAEQNASLLAFRNKFVADVAAVTDGKPQNGVYVDSCYVHEQNVNYCSGQGMPNCVGWSPLESGSRKWGYNVNVSVSDGRQLTPQQAFSAYYFGDRVASIAVDAHDFFDNPSCLYLGKPAPPPSPSPTPPPGTCEDFSGDWIDNPNWFTPVHFQQSGCAGAFLESNSGPTFTVSGKTITTSADFHGGLTGVIEFQDSQDVIQWSNHATWERNCSDFSGDWIDNSSWSTPIPFMQEGCSGSFQKHTYRVHGDKMMTSADFYNGLVGLLVRGDGQDTIEWANGAMWERAIATALVV